jgi:hypothetical protein
LLSGLPFTHQLTHHLILVVRRKLVTNPTIERRDGDARCGKVVGRSRFPRLMPEVD